jgi:hypothetical protein
VSPVKYELGFYIPEDGILQVRRRYKESVSQYSDRIRIHRQGSILDRYMKPSLLYSVATIYGTHPEFCTMGTREYAVGN